MFGLCTINYFFCSLLNLLSLILFLLIFIILCVCVCVCVCVVRVRGENVQCYSLPIRQCVVNIIFNEAENILRHIYFKTILWSLLPFYVSMLGVLKMLLCSFQTVLKIPCRTNTPLFFLDQFDHELHNLCPSTART